MTSAIHGDHDMLGANLAKPVKITIDNIFGLPDDSNLTLTQMIFQLMLGWQQIALKPAGIIDGF